jgi:hypothetical protein
VIVNFNAPRAVGQVEQPETTALVDKLVEEGKAFDKACDSVASQRAFEEALKLRPKDPAILCALSKELSDRVFDHEIFHNKPMARKFASDASELANKAISIAPYRCSVLYCVCRGEMLVSACLARFDRESSSLTPSRTTC